MSAYKQVEQVEHVLGPGWDMFTRLSPLHEDNGGRLEYPGSPGEVDVPHGYEEDGVVLKKDDDLWITLYTDTGRYRVAPGFFGPAISPEMRIELEETRTYLEGEMRYTEVCR